MESVIVPIRALPLQQERANLRANLGRLMARQPGSSLIRKVREHRWMQVRWTLLLKSLQQLFFENYNGAIALGNSGHLRGVPNTLICKESHPSF